MNSIVGHWKGLLENKSFVHFIFAWLDTIFPIYVFVVCSKFRFKELGQELLNNRWLLLKTFLVTAILVPLIAAGAVKFISVPLMLGGIMLIAATAPGDPFDLVESHGKKGGLLMASALMLFLVLVMPLTVPCWMWIFTKWFPSYQLAVSPAEIFHAVAPKVLPPLLISLVLREILPSWVDKISALLHKYFEISAILITIYFIPFAIAKIFTFGISGALAIFIVTTLTLFAGYYLDSGQSRKDRISIALTVSLGNMAAVLFIAHQCYPKKLDMIDFILVIFGWIVLRWVIIWFWYFFMKFRISQKGESLA